MIWWKNIITGRDNSTVSIGRLMGIIVFGLFVIALPVVAIVTVRAGKVPASEWQTVLAAMQVYVPAIVLSVGGLIGLTNNSEPPHDSGS